MNGSKFVQLFTVSFLLLSSCVDKHVIAEEGEALFLLYRGVPQRVVGDVSIWVNPQQYLSAEQQYIPKNFHSFLSVFDKNYLVVRLGNLKGKYTIDRMIYRDLGERLDIKLLAIENQQQIPNDIGYPIFIQKKRIKHIVIFSNEQQIYQTNFLKNSLAS